MRLRALDGKECRRVHATALRLLGRVGVHVADDDTRRRLRQAGCRESPEGRLLFGEELVGRVLESVPPRLMLYDRDGRPAVDTAAARPCFAPGLNCVQVLDYDSGEHRPALLRDVREAARLCDRLANVDLAAGLGNPSDLPPARQALETVRALAQGCRKPLAFIAHDEVEDEEIWGYLAELAGGWEALASRPFALDLTGPYSPLELGAEACRRLRFAARHGLPVVCYPALLTGAAGPVTLAGALAQSAAEILAGLVVHQLEGPGAPVLSGSAILPMDLRTGTVSYGSPEYTLSCLGAVDYFREIGVPTWFGAGCSDAHRLDLQAAAEAAAGLQIAVLSGTSFVHNLGYLSGGKTGSLGMLVLGDELAGMARVLAAGITVDRDNLAEEVVGRATAGHSFLTDPHTLEHMRSAMWVPGLFQRAALPDWVASGSLPLQERVRARVRELLA